MESDQYPEYNTINGRDTTHFDSEDDYRTSCRNVSRGQKQQSYSGLRSPGRLNSPTFEMTHAFQTFHSCQSNFGCKIIFTRYSLFKESIGHVTS